MVENFSVYRADYLSNCFTCYVTLTFDWMHLSGWPSPFSSDCFFCTSTSFFPTTTPALSVVEVHKRVTFTGWYSFACKLSLYNASLELSLKWSLILVDGTIAKIINFSLLEHETLPSAMILIPPLRAASVIHTLMVDLDWCKHSAGAH